MINDHLSDLFARLKNAYAVGKKELTLPHTKVCEAVAKLLVETKYLKRCEVISTSAHPTLKLTLSYHGRTPSLSHIRRVSKPGVRIYRSTHQFKPVLSGLGLAILSTSQGILSDTQAKKAKVGGEVLAELW